MSCFLSEFLIPEDSKSLFYVYCQYCQCRKACPYLCSQSLHRAARQGQTSARCLTAAAGRLLDAISHADSVCGLLNADVALERTLSQALRSEIAMINGIRDTL